MKVRITQVKMSEIYKKIKKIHQYLEDVSISKNYETTYSKLEEKDELSKKYNFCKNLDEAYEKEEIRSAWV